jgi:hypothetical protein
LYEVSKIVKSIEAAEWLFTGIGEKGKASHIHLVGYHIKQTTQKIASVDKVEGLLFYGYISSDLQDICWFTTT